jgi:hypothetical protein
MTLQQEFAEKSRIESPAATMLNPTQIQKLPQLFPHVFSLESAEDQGVLQINRAALQESLREQKLKLRQHLAEAAGIEMTRVVKLPATWPARSQPPSRIVIVLHGIHSTPAAGEAVAMQLHEKTKLPMFLYLYPNDAPVTESAGEFIKALQKISTDSPGASISVVAYSLGGLVARSALEWPAWKDELKGQKIDQLIMVCPPNHGSALWEYAPLLEGAEVWQRIANHEAIGRPWRRIVSSISDGFNEASADLRPESPWLLELNRQPRPDHVRYTIIAGDRGPIRPVAGMLIQVGLKQFEENVEFGPLVDRLAKVTRMGELQQGRGDGVVKVEATKLAGVHDWELIPISHLDWGQVESVAGQALADAMARRLKSSAIQHHP